MHAHDDGTQRQTVVGVVLTLVALLVYMTRSSPQARPMKRDWVKGRIYLYQMPRTFVVPSLSYFSLKLETWLRMAGLDYEVQ